MFKLLFTFYLHTLPIEKSTVVLLQGLVTNNKDSENIIDKSKAKNYNNGSNNGNNMDNNDFRDGNSSNNNKGNNAYFSSSLTYSLKELSKSSSTFTQKVYKSLNVITGRLNVLSKFIGLSNDF